MPRCLRCWRVPHPGCSIMLALLAACGHVVMPEADPCANTVCQCTVQTQATDCASHQICDVSGPGRKCACAAGYADHGAGCVFDGAPRDPGFSDPTAWTQIGVGATVDGAVAGNVDKGEAVFTSNGMCSFAGLKQTFTMPARDRAEPFKLAVTHTAVDPDELGFNGSVSIGVAGQFIEANPAVNVFQTSTICLGPRAY